jgi:hypothetical protein
MSNTKNRTAIRLSLALFAVALMAAPASAQQRWIHLYNGSSNWDWGYSVQTTADNGFIFAGDKSSFDNNGDIYLMNTDASGDSQWTRSCGDRYRQGSRCVRRAPDGGYIIAGFYYAAMCLVKTDANGSASIEEETSPIGQSAARGLRPGATVIRGVLGISSQLTANGSQPGIGLLDISGRKVMELRPGLNDVSRFAPGVYFIVQRGAMNDKRGTTKVMITR